LVIFLFVCSRWFSEHDKKNFFNIKKIFLPLTQMLAILDPEIGRDNISDNYARGQPLEMYKYALRYGCQRMTAFYRTSILGMGELFGRLLELDPIFHSQRTIEDVWSFFASLTIVRDEDQLDLWYLQRACEAFLRRCTIDNLPADTKEWWIYLPHDKYSFLSFWSLFVTTRFGDGQSAAMVQFRFRNPEYIPYYGKIQNIECELTEKYANTMELVQSVTQRSKSKLKKAYSHYWLINTFLNIQHNCINSTPDAYLEHLFVRTDTRKTRRYENTLNTALPTPVVMRQFNSAHFLMHDIEELKNPHTLELVDALKLTADPTGCYFLLEQSAFMIKLLVDYYMVPHQARFKLTVLPRTSNSCYLIGSSESVRMFRQCQLVDMLTDCNIYRKYRTNYSANLRSKLRGLKQPPMFPVVVRTWIDSTSSASIGVQNDQNSNGRYLCAVGLQQVLLTLVRWCYMAAQKDLTNTWFSNVWSSMTETADTDRHLRFSWNTRETEGAMSAAMLDPNNVNFHSFYSHFFLLLERGWASAVDLRKSILEAVLTPPGIDDYVHPGDCSLFAFVESFVFINATHMIAWDVIEWLHAGVQLLEFSALTLEEAQARQLNFNTIAFMTEMARNFPPLVPLANSLMQLYHLQQTRVNIDSTYKYELYKKWLLLDSVDIPQREFLVHTYYMLASCSLWSSSEVRRFLLGCRLAPRSHYIATMSKPNSSSSTTAAAVPMAPEEEEKQPPTKDHSDEDSSDWDENITGVELLQRSIASVISDSRPSQYGSDDDDDGDTTYVSLSLDVYI